MSSGKNSFLVMVCFLFVFLVPQAVFSAGAAEDLDTDTNIPGEISLIVPYSAGGGTDRSARTIAGYLEKAIDSTIVVVNRPGAGGAFGMEEIIESDASKGDVIGLVPYPAVVTTLQNSKHDPQDYDYLVSFTQTPPALILAPKSRFSNLDELVEFARANPGQVVASESGGTLLLNAILFQDEAGIDITTVNYDGAGESLSALLGGHVDAAFISAQFIENAKAEGAIPIAIANDERLEAYPDVPTYMEKGFEVVTPISRIIVAPKNIPDSIRQEILSGLIQVGESADFKADMIKNGEIPRLLVDKDAANYVLNGAKRINALYEKYADKFKRD